MNSMKIALLGATGFVGLALLNEVWRAPPLLPVAISAAGGIIRAQAAP